MLAVSKFTIRRLVKRGAFVAPIRVASELRWETEAVKAWIEAQRAKAVPQ